MESKRVICHSCDIKCNVLADVEDGKLLQIRRNPDHPITPHALCNKGAAMADVVYHKDRLRTPLKRVGERGSGQWEEIGWEQALDEIAERLTSSIAQYGPESLVAAGGTIVPLDIPKRFMNVLGCPNWVYAGYLCLGNTTGPNKVTNGWMPFPDYWRTQTIVLWGHDPQPNKWTAEYLWIRDALKRGAKLITVDPRVGFSSKRADIHLRLRPGSDPALALGWINVIVNEELYDKDFVANHTHGFEELKERVQEYSPERVEELTWVPADQIRAAARMYATSGPAVIPWTPVTDQHSNSTQSIRCFAILRAICGYIDVPGGEMLMGFNPNVITENEVQMDHAISPDQRKKQLGVETNKLFSYELWEKMNEANERVFGRPWASQISGAVMSRPGAIWDAMITGDPYPVKSMITVGSNTLGAYTNGNHVRQGLENLDLLVVMDIFMVPTAQMADYVLPAATWAEKPVVNNHWDWHTIVMGGEQAIEPIGDSKSEFYFWRNLAHRMGQAEHWPWETVEDFYDWRLAKTGMTHAEFMAAGGVNFPAPEWEKHKKVGFATPTGKVELYSTLLEEFGYDPLPKYVEQRDTPINRPDLAEEYPLYFFNGDKSEPFFQSQGRNIESLRKLAPEPWVEIFPDTGYDLDLVDGDYVAVESLHGRIEAVVKFCHDAHPKCIRVPYMWWFPEQEAYAPHYSGQFVAHDGLLMGDSMDVSDPEQGIPAMRGTMCKVYKIERPAFWKPFESGTKHWHGAGSEAALA
ncbi:MAG: molybdopterin-containing oxidoreductase family protein [Sporichthyaceae bacterium]